MALTSARSGGGEGRPHKSLMKPPNRLANNRPTLPPFSFISQTKKKKSLNKWIYSTCFGTSKYPGCPLQISFTLHQNVILVPSGLWASWICSCTTRHVPTAQTAAAATDQEVPLSMVGSLDARAGYIPEFCVGRMGIMFKEALRVIRRAIWQFPCNSCLPLKSTTDCTFMPHKTRMLRPNPQSHGIRRCGLWELLQ